MSVLKFLCTCECKKIYVWRVSELFDIRRKGKNAFESFPLGISISFNQKESRFLENASNTPVKFAFEGFSATMYKHWKPIIMKAKITWNSKTYTNYT
jgi:hypothetical protein